MGESSKNHKTDSENLKKSGVITFFTDENGFNPGKFLQLYLETTNAKCDRLFQRPQREAKWFNIHDFAIDVFFENKPMGKNMIGEMLKKLCDAAGTSEKFTNHCVRATGITNLVDLGYQDRAITNLSGKLPLFLRLTQL